VAYKVASFLDAVGLPPRGTPNKTLEALFLEYLKLPNNDDGNTDASVLKGKYGCEFISPADDQLLSTTTDETQGVEVEIEALALFDLVSTVGLPRTGLLKYFPRWHSKQDTILMRLPNSKSSRSRHRLHPAKTDSVLQMCATLTTQWRSTKNARLSLTPSYSLIPPTNPNRSSTRPGSQAAMRTWAPITIMALVPSTTVLRHGYSPRSNNWVFPPTKPPSIIALAR
jgi:hypothetical protein